MKLATLKDGTRDGTLLVVSRDLTHAVKATDIAGTLQQALDHWDQCLPSLQALSDALNAGTAAGAFHFDENKVHSPLPRAYQWLDGSVYLSHVERVRKARGVDMPPEFLADPLMYQGNSEYFVGPRDPVVGDESWGIDLEGEVAVILGDVPLGTSRDQASKYIRLIMLVNDVSLRLLIPEELKKGFGFVQGKGQTAFSPVAVTPDELGQYWDGGTVHHRLSVSINAARFGEPKADLDMFFNFPRLIEHAAKTRPLGAGTVLGSGTISNYAEDAGYAAIAEIRAVEMVRDGRASTPFFRHGDRVRIEMRDETGQTIFGAIDQEIVALP